MMNRNLIDINSRITLEEAGGLNVCAFLDMLAYSEGTDNNRQKTENHGYDVIVGGGLFSDYSKHPNRLIPIKNLGISSTAAGRYQLLYRYWVSYCKTLGLNDFSPLSQDKIAIQQIKERRAIPLIQRGDFIAAVHACKNIWASLPGAGYGQHEQKIESLIASYKLSGGEVSV